MGRLDDRLKKNRPFPLTPPEGYENYYESPQYQNEISSTQDQTLQDQAQETQNALVQQYNETQRRAMEYDKEIATIEKTNPHTLYKDVVTKPSDKGAYPMTIMGRPVDLSALENYLVFKISPKTITTMMRFNNSKTMEDIKGYSKRPPMKMKGGILLIIIGAAALLIVGMIILMYGGELGTMLGDMFGGMM